MKVTLDLEITEFQENALSRLLLQGQAVTEEFLRGFCKDTVAQALKELCDMYLYDSVTTQFFEEMKE